jgi:dUTP pyrophosphatase
MHPEVIPYTFEHLNNERLTKAHADDAAYDLRAAESGHLPAGDRMPVKTGLRLAIPVGFAGLVLPRSGLAMKHGITVLNAPGLIDPGYRGEVGVILHNASCPVYEPYDDGNLAFDNLNGFRFERGDRIAQLIIIGVGDFELVYWSPAAFESLLETTRSEGGFGSTGR